MAAKIYIILMWTNYKNKDRRSHCVTTMQEVFKLDFIYN